MVHTPNNNGSVYMFNAGPNVDHKRKYSIFFLRIILLGAWFDLLVCVCVVHMYLVDFENQLVRAAENNIDLNFHHFNKLIIFNDKKTTIY